MPNSTNVNIGNSGEYFVAGELERRGYTVAVPMSNVKDFDILAIHRETHEQFAIQVKTTGYKKKKWTLSKKNETLEGDHIFYVFVSLNDLDTPEYHVVPSKVVAKTIRESHRKWLETPGKKGQLHNDNSIREFYDLEDSYRDKWCLLEISDLDDRLQPKGIYKSLTAYILRLSDKNDTRAVRDLIREVYEFQEEHPEFQLNRYIDVLLKNGIQWGQQTMMEANVDQLSGQATVALLLGAIRGDRFCNGVLDSLVESGCINKWLMRLQEIGS